MAGLSIAQGHGQVNWDCEDTYASVRGHFGFTWHLVLGDGAWLVCILYVGELIVVGLFAIYSLHKQFFLHYSSSNRIRGMF